MRYFTHLSLLVLACFLAPLMAFTGVAYGQDNARDMLVYKTPG